MDITIVTYTFNDYGFFWVLFVLYWTPCLIRALHYARCEHTDPTNHYDVVLGIVGSTHMLLQFSIAGDMGVSLIEQIMLTNYFYLTDILAIISLYRVLRCYEDYFDIRQRNP